MCLIFEKNYLPKFHSNPKKSGTPLVFLYSMKNMAAPWLMKICEHKDNHDTLDNFKLICFKVVKNS